MTRPAEPCSLDMRSWVEHLPTQMTQSPTSITGRLTRSEACGAQSISPPGSSVHETVLKRPSSTAALSCKMPPMRYSADLTAGSLKLPESRVVADLLIRGVSEAEWKTAVQVENVLQARSVTTANRLARLLRSRLESMDVDLWRLVRDGSSTVATHACLAAAIKHSRLLGDFLDLVVREEYRTFAAKLSPKLWEPFLEDCRNRDPEMPVWNASTVTRLRSSVFQILAQAGYIESTKTMRLQTVHISAEVLRYLRDHDERYVLRCIEVGA